MNESMINNRLANIAATYKIWDWDRVEAPFTRKEVIKQMYEDIDEEEEETITDKDISANDYGRAKFISDIVMNKDQNELLVDDEVKFWRRKDILIPGTEIEIPSKTIQVHLLKEKPVEKKREQATMDGMDDMEDYYEEEEEYQDDENDSTETITNQDRCIYIGGLLSMSECTDLIHSTDKLGYEEMDKEYPMEYRNSQRVLVKSKKLADIVWNRIIPHLKMSDFKDVKPYGFDNVGCWIPCGINECMRFNRYTSGTFFKPHTDAQFVRNDDEKSIFTVLIYLNSSESGTTLLKKVGERVEDNNLVFDFKKLTTVHPTEGTVIIFNHDLYHEGQKVWCGSKYVVRSEIIFKRIDKDSIYRMDYRNSEEFKKVKKLIDESYELEHQGNLTQSTIKYVQAMDMQISMSHSLKRTSIRKLSFIEETLPEEVFVHIFDYLTDEEVCKNILPINSDLNMFARNENMWQQRYSKKWENEPLEKLILDRMIRYKYYEDYEEPPKEVKGPFHSRENQIINALQSEVHDWYNAFSTRSNMEKYFNAVLLDLGKHSYKYGMANTNAFLRSMTTFGIPTHPHFYLPSYGFDDTIIGDRLSGNQHHCELINFFNSKGLPKKKLLKIFLYQLYKDDLRVKLQEHPLVMAVPPNWEKSYLEKIEQIVFSLDIPAVHFVDSFKLLALYYQKPTSLIISVTPSGSTCVPVIDCESKTSLMDIFEIDLFEEYKNKNSDIGYYEYTFREELSEFMKIAPCSHQQDEKTFNNFIKELEPFEWPYCVSPAVERVEMTEHFYTNVLESVKKSISLILNIEISSLEKEQVETVLSNIVVVGGLSCLHGFRERFKNDLLKLINEYSPTFTFREDKAEFSVRVQGVKVCIVGQDMDVVGGARIVANLANFREICKYKNKL